MSPWVLLAIAIVMVFMAVHDGPTPTGGVGVRDGLV